MSYSVLESNRWFDGALCCRYLVVRFGKLRIPLMQGGIREASEWHWALGFFTDGRLKVIGAWQDACADTPARIFLDLRKRGIERIRAVAAEDNLLDAMSGLKFSAGGRTVAELAESGAFGPRMQRAIRWTDTAGQHLQERLGRLARRQTPFVDASAAEDFIANAFQRSERDLLQDRWDRSRQAPFGQGAFVASLAGTA